MKRNNNIIFVPANTYKLATSKQLALVVPGTFVKIKSNNEYYWVKVTERNGRKIKGTVANDTIFPGNPPFGTVLEILASEVYDVYTGEPL